ncbi:MAG TPA: YaiI/YqxD family protein [Clostridiales bacterium]|nr:YaiI/YqxD family protein [Clostridiales bacterium]
MRILVDADACPVKNLIEKIAKELKIPVIMFVDTSHVLKSDYSEIVIVSKAPDAVDFVLINNSEKGDVIVTQDYGVAAMALGKGAYAIHPNGKVYTDFNIDMMLAQRHAARVNRMAGNKPYKQQKRRINTDDNNFYDSFYELCEKALNQQK